MDNIDYVDRYIACDITKALSSLVVIVSSCHKVADESSRIVVQCFKVFN